MQVKARLLTLLTAIILSCSFSIVQAQVGPGDPGDPGDPGGDPGGGDTSIPFDGGIGLLVAAAVGYGAKKIHDRRKEAMQKE